MTSPRAPMAAMVLAAGSSRRMGAANKLLTGFRGRPILIRVIDTLESCPGVDQIVVVTGHEAEHIRAALADRPITWIHNPDHERGMGTSLATGVAALSPDTRAVLVCLGDMPLLAPTHVRALRDRFERTQGPCICVPVFQGQRGHPVLFSAHFLDALRALDGDTGARHLLRQHPDQVHDVEVPDPGVLADVDTPDALERLSDES